MTVGIRTRLAQILLALNITFDVPPFYNTSVG